MGLITAAVIIIICLVLAEIEELLLPSLYQ